MSAPSPGRVTVSVAGLVFDESVNTDELVADKVAQLKSPGILAK